MLSSLVFEQDPAQGSIKLLRGVETEFYDQSKSPYSGTEDIYVKSVAFTLGVDSLTGKQGICYLRVDLTDSVANKTPEDVAWEDVGDATCGTLTHQISGFVDNAPTHDALPKLIGFFGTHFDRVDGNKERKIMNSLGFEYVTSGPECVPPPNELRWKLPVEVPIVKLLPDGSVQTFDVFYEVLNGMD